MRVTVAEIDEDISLDAMWRAYRHRRSSGVESSLTATVWPRWGTLGIDGGGSSGSAKSGAGVGQSIFIGQYSDTATGLSYLQNRYYSPTQGQFLSEDPTFLAFGNSGQLQQLSQETQNQVLSNPQQLNAYSYSEDNPITNKDPSGLWALQLGGEYTIPYFGLTG